MKKSLVLSKVEGFTLLEMLVVIGIVAILVSLGFASYSTVQKKARDAKRQGDLKAAQQVMEQCYSVNNFTYPNTGDLTLTNSGSTHVLSATCAADASITFSITDPLSLGTHIYTIESSSTSDYTLQAVLETSVDPFTVSNQQ